MRLTYQEKLQFVVNIRAETQKLRDYYDEKEEYYYWSTLNHVVDKLNDVKDALQKEMLG